MSLHLSRRTVVALVTLLLVTTALVVNSQPLRNVVVMISDDLSPFYLDPNHPVKMPNVKNLASRGTEFTNAHSALSSCGPSRMAFMTGRYPMTTNLFTFERWVPQVSGLKTVAQYLAEKHGYETISFGKVFHEDWRGTGDGRVMGMYQAGLWTHPPRGGGSGDGECYSLWYCKVKRFASSGDYRLSRSFVQFLQTRNASRPLLAFVGFRKPHMEIGVPLAFVRKRFPGRDYITPTTPSSLGRNQTVVPYGTSLQIHQCYWEILKRRINGQRAYPATRYLEPRYWKTLQNIRHFYFAAINYVDSLIGYVVNNVDRHPAYANNTAFVFISDHGFANGEHSMFCKTSLFEQATRSAFVVAPARNMEGVDRGRVRTDPINLVDLFPTVVHLATDVVLPREATVDTSGMQLDGWSVLQKDRPVLSLYTFSMVHRCNAVHTIHRWQCIIGVTACSRLPNLFIGLMVRTKTKKYVQWRRFHDKITHCDRPNWPGMSPAARARIMPVNQIDPSQTKTDFTSPPVQQELYEDLPGEAIAAWGDWEKSNVLVDKMNDTSVIGDAMELSAAIRWKFDPDFAGAVEPCSGNGIVRLVNRSAWVSADMDPEREDVVCECLEGFAGPECNETVSLSPSSVSPSMSPSSRPTSAMPSKVPSSSPSFHPTTSPSEAPSSSPTIKETSSPSETPSPMTTSPSMAPSSTPSPSLKPTSFTPSESPSLSPSEPSSTSPTSSPSAISPQRTS